MIEDTMYDHTPGPWRVEFGDGDANEINMIFVAHEGTECNETTICNFDIYDSREDHEANAKLIAAAPYLLKERDELRELIREIVSAEPDFDDPRSTTYNLVVDKEDYKRARELCGIDTE